MSTETIYVAGGNCVGATDIKAINNFFDSWIYAHCCTYIFEQSCVYTLGFLWWKQNAY